MLGKEKPRATTIVPSQREVGPIHPKKIKLLWALPEDNLSTLTRDIQLEKVVECFAFLAFKFTLVRVSIATQLWI